MMYLSLILSISSFNNLTTHDQDPGEIDFSSRLDMMLSPGLCSILNFFSVSQLKQINLDEDELLPSMGVEYLSNAAFGKLFSPMSFDWLIYDLPWTINIFNVKVLFRGPVLLKMTTETFARMSWSTRSPSLKTRVTLLQLLIRTLLPFWRILICKINV